MTIEIKATEETKTFTASVQPKHFKALMPCMGEDVSRYYLKGVAVHFWGDNKATLVATNGHLLGEIDGNPERTHGDIHCIIPAECVKKIAALKDATVTLEFTGATIVVHYGAGRMMAAPIDGQYPDYLRIMRVNNEKAPVHGASLFISPMSKILKVADTLSKNTVFELELGAFGHLTHKFTVRSVDNFVGVIMGVREV